MKGKTTLYGFEDYKVFKLYGDFFMSSISYNSQPHLRRCDDKNFALVESFPSLHVEDGDNNSTEEIKVDESLFNDHKELLDTAKKVYVHKDCHISRTVVASKYQKSLNPWMADAVAIPDIKDGRDALWASKVVLFINENARMIVVWEPYFYLDEVKNTISNLREGMRIADIIPPGKEIDNSWNATRTDCDNASEAVFMQMGHIMDIRNGDSFILDILANNIPASKIVYETTIQKSLASEENKVTLDFLISIKEMLDSDDEDTVSAGIKALSMMDYMHYPNSVKYILNNASYKFRYSKACDSVPVKFMLKSLNEGSWSSRSANLRFSTSIYEDDFEMYKQLLGHYTKGSIMNELNYLPFMTINGAGMLVPKLKKAD